MYQWYSEVMWEPSQHTLLSPSLPQQSLEMRKEVENIWLESGNMQVSWKYETRKRLLFFNMIRIEQRHTLSNFEKNIFYGLRLGNT